MADRPVAPRLMLITDAPRARLPLLELAAEAVAGGVDAIYLRDVHLRSSDLARVVRRLRETIGDKAALLVNGGVEAAQEAGTGLHLRERDPLPAAARAILGPAALIGRSVHSPAAAADSTGATHLLAGHVYPSASKPGQPPLGLAGFAAIAAAAPCPTLAIGGITAQRAPDVVQAGAHGIAVIGAIVEAADPRQAAAALRAALDCALSEQMETVTMPEPTPTLTSAATTFEIVVNGKTVSVPAGATVHDFLASKRMTDAMAIVERNGEIVPRPAYPTTPLTPGDRLEVVHAVGGG
jgi:thiamine biosynthesis protein ThiS